MDMERRLLWPWSWRPRPAHPGGAPLLWFQGHHPRILMEACPRGGWASRTASRLTLEMIMSSKLPLETGQYLGECKGHEGTIHEISFSAPSSPQVICSCSSDGTVRAWDTRNFKQISLLRGGVSQEMFTFAFGGSNGSLLAAGSNAQVLFWDWRSSRQIACLEESHMDDVTQVKFTPDQQSKLISAAVDGLICVFDTDGDIDDDNHLLSVMNAETSVAKVGFFGNKYKKLWCLTHIETLRLTISLIVTILCLMTGYG
uniref:Transducin family protein / WD-40 repeat family protein n=1 Tax=Zea mays TaxID=4577 RepID=A0A804NFM4_MAIZE